MIPGRESLDFFMAANHPILLSALMLIASNVFMTFAWYGHLKHLNHKAW